jgi:hypothetical protein
MAMTKAELERRVKELEAQVEGSAITYKVSEKGAVSVYGLGRFPVTLYRSQWEKLLDHSGELRSFITLNESKLKVKKS